MATAYPKFTSASTGLTTWSDGRTSSYANPTPVSSGTIGRTQTASVTSALSRLLSQVMSYLGQQTTGAVNTITSGGSGVSTTGKSMAVNPKTQPTYTETQPTYTVKNGQLVVVPKTSPNQGVATKSQPVLNAKNQAITGAYTKNSSGSYAEVPMQSLGYTATGN